MSHAVVKEVQVERRGHNLAQSVAMLYCVGNYKCRWGVCHGNRTLCELFGWIFYMNMGWWGVKHDLVVFLISVTVCELLQHISRCFIFQIMKLSVKGFENPFAEF